MAKLSDEFFFDASLEEASSACAGAVEDLGWLTKDRAADHIVAHAITAPVQHPPQIEIDLSPEDGGTSIRITGIELDAVDPDQSVLVAELDRVQKAISTAAEGMENRSEPEVPAGWFPDAYDKTRLQYWDGERWTDQYRQVDPSPPTETLARDKQADAQIEVSPVGIGLALAGAALMVVGVFLPHVESHRFGFVADNTLIQSGDGWIFIGLAVGIALAVYATTRRKRKTRAILILAAIGIAAAIYDGTGDRVTLSSLNPGAASALGIQGTEKASPGTGIYAVGAGSGLAGLGGLLLAGVAFGAVKDLPDRRLKQCPDCAETILTDAKVCKHCGFRFGSA